MINKQIKTFLQDEKRSNRSLEIEATKMASFLVDEYKVYLNNI